MSTPVVIGSGLAGLSTALELSRSGPVTLVTGGRLTQDAASTWAQGGIAAALAPGDSPAAHARDTWLAGARAGDRAVIERVTAAAPAVVQQLLRRRVPFDLTPGGSLDLALEGGHSCARIAHAGDHSGAAITAVLAAAVQAADQVRVLESHRAVDLLTDPCGAICAVLVDGPDGEITLDTDRVVLATGGLSALFAHTTNPLGAQGGGVALAARLGARTDDLHLVQFHPTALDIGVDPAPLLTEALRGAGAVLLADGERFTDELRPRDIVSAAVWEQLQAGRRVTLDASAVTDAANRFPAVTALLEPHGLSLADRLPVRPAAHYAMGGVSVDAQSRTSVPGLWAVGETARTGLHGANRLASNSLLEAVVTGQAAAASIAARADGIGPWDTGIPRSDPAALRPRQAVDSSVPSIRTRLDQTCGVLRSASALSETVRALEPDTGSDPGYVAWLVARSALAHPHSVGAHRRVDEAQAVPA